MFLYLIMAASSISTAYAGDLENVKKDETALWEGTGATDATYSAVTLSMVGWGVGLAAGIGILASAIHQSSSSHDSSSSSH